MIGIRYVPSESEHENQKWLVLEGYIEGIPEVTKRRAINTAALADGSLTLDGEKQKLMADVTEYYSRYMAVKEQLRNL